MIQPSQTRRRFLLGAATVLTSPEPAASLRKTDSTASMDIVRIAAAADLRLGLIADGLIEIQIPPNRIIIFDDALDQAAAKFSVQ